MDNLEFHNPSLEDINNRRLALRVLQHNNYAYGELVRRIEQAKSRPAATTKHPNWFDIVGQSYFYADQLDSSRILEAIEKVLALGGRPCPKPEDYAKIEGLVPPSAKTTSHQRRQLLLPVMEVPAASHNPTVYMGFDGCCILDDNGKFWSIKDVKRRGVRGVSDVARNVIEEFLERRGSGTAVTYVSHIGTRLLVKIQITSVLGNSNELLAIAAKNGDAWTMKYNEFCKSSVHGDTWETHLMYEWDGESLEDYVDWRIDCGFVSFMSCNAQSDRKYIDENIVIPEGEPAKYEPSFAEQAAANPSILYKTIVNKYAPPNISQSYREGYVKATYGLWNARLANGVKKSKKPKAVDESQQTTEYNELTNDVLDCMMKGGVSLSFKQDWEIIEDLDLEETAQAFRDEWKAATASILANDLVDVSRGKIVPALRFCQLAVKFYKGKYSRCGDSWYVLKEAHDAEKGAKQVMKWVEISKKASRTPNGAFGAIYRDFRDYCRGILDDIMKQHSGSGSDQVIYSAALIHRNKLEEDGIIPKVSKLIYDYLADERHGRSGGLVEKLDKDMRVIGCYGGVVDLHAEPVFLDHYTPFFVSKSVNAHYTRFRLDDPYIAKWMQIISEIIVEPDARDKIMMRYAAKLGVDGPMLQLFIGIGSGANGKSLLSDAVNTVLGSYSKKISSSLITGRPAAGAADPDLYQLKGLRGAYMAETGSADNLNVMRLKEISEKTISTRTLYTDSESFENHCVTEMYTNHPPSIPDLDGGAERRLAVYNFKRKFGPNEKNTNYEKLAGHPNFASALFAILIHYRRILREHYHDDWERVPSATIDAETQEYLNVCVPLNAFMDVVVRYFAGFKPDGTSLNDEALKRKIEQSQEYFTPISELAKKYRDWYRGRKGKEAADIDYVERHMRNHKRIAANVVLREDIYCVAGVLAFD